MSQLTAELPSASIHPSVAIPAALEAEFHQHLDRWLADTADVSDVREVVCHPSHLRIIGLGPAVLPLIFRMLERRRGLWFWALEALTGADPVPDGQQSMKEIRSAWLRYGKSSGYL